MPNHKLDLDGDRRELIPSDDPPERKPARLDLAGDARDLTGPRARAPREPRPVEDPWVLMVIWSQDHRTQMLATMRESRAGSHRLSRVRWLRRHEGPEPPPGWRIAVSMVRDARPGTIAEVERILLRAMLESLG